MGGIRFELKEGQRVRTQPYTDAGLASHYCFVYGSVVKIGRTRAQVKLDGYEKPISVRIKDLIAVDTHFARNPETDVAYELKGDEPPRALETFKLDENRWGPIEDDGLQYLYRRIPQ